MSCPTTFNNDVNALSKRQTIIFLEIFAKASALHKDNIWRKKSLGIDVHKIGVSG